MWRRSSMLLVGTLWSTVATVRSGRRSLRPAIRSPSKGSGRVPRGTNCGRVEGGDGVGVEDPEGVFGAGLIRFFTVFDPVDGGEDDQRMRTVEVDPEHATRRAEAKDATGDGEIAVVVGHDLVGDGEEVEGSFIEWLVAGFGVAPEGLGGGEVLGEE